MKNPFQLTLYLTNHFTAEESKRIMQPHKHSSLEFSYVIDGELTVDYLSAKSKKFETVSIFPKQFFIMAPYCPHSVHIPHSLNSIGFELNPASQDFYALLNNSEYFRSMPLALETLQKFNDILILNDTQNVYHTILQLRPFASNRNDMFSDQLYDLQLKKLLIELLKCTQGAIPSSKQNLYLKKAIIFIEANYQKNVTAQILGNYLGLSEVYIQKLFRENLKTTVNQTLNDVRIKKAQVLLAASNYAVNEIAKTVGYTSIQTFMTNFKRHTGYTPSEYKKKTTKEDFHFFAPQENYHEEKI